MNVKIGMIGTGRIAQRFVPEARLVNGVTVQGVYNPHRKSAKAFAEKWEIHFYENIEKFYEDIEAVYIASPHETHYEYVKSALEHGKHVLCEKPMCLNAQQAEELFSYASENNLVLMEGIKTAYCPGFAKLLEIAFSGAIGEIRCVDACFTKLENPNNRELTNQTYGGSFIELGCYCMLPIMKLFGTEYQKVRFDAIEGENGLDLFTRANFSFPNGFATATCGLGVKSEGKLLISGTKGYIIVEAPWWKTNYFEVHYEDASRVEKYSDRFAGDGLRYELEDFIAEINGDSKGELKLSGEESEAMAGVMEQFMKELGRE